MPLLQGEGDKTEDPSQKYRMMTAALSGLPNLLAMILDGKPNAEGGWDFDYSTSRNLESGLKNYACLLSDLLDKKKLGSKDECLQVYDDAILALDAWCNSVAPPKKAGKSVWTALWMAFSCVTGNYP